MKLLSAAIAFSTLATSQAATSSSSAAISETKRLRNVNVYKSEKNGPADRDRQSFSDVRALQFLDIEVSLSLSASLPSDVAITPTTAPATGAPSTGAPSSDTPTTSMAPSAAPSGILAKGEESKVPSSTLAPSTAAPYSTVIETPIITTQSPTSTSTQCTICETGEIIDSELIISGLDVTCGQASDFALTVPAGEAECTQVVAAAKDVCCQMEFPSDIDVDGSISLDGSNSFDYVPTITPIGSIDTTAPSPSSSSSPGTSSDEPSSPSPTGVPITLIPAPKSSAMMMSTMGGATCLIASLIAYVGLF